MEEICYPNDPRHCCSQCQKEKIVTSNNSEYMRLQQQHSAKILKSAAVPVHKPGNKRVMALPPKLSEPPTQPHSSPLNRGPSIPITLSKTQPQNQPQKLPQNVMGAQNQNQRNHFQQKVNMNNRR